MEPFLVNLLMVAGFLVGLAIPVLLLAGIARWIFSGAGDAAEVEDLGVGAGSSAGGSEPEEVDEDEFGSGFSARGAEAPVLPPNVRMPAKDEKVVQVMATASRLHADLLRARLLDRGIWCFVSGDLNALSTLGLAEAALHVPAGDVDRARLVIAEAETEARDNRASAGRLKCPACGYDLRATPVRCPECGLNLT